ncbi:MAG: prolyl oligopeptidase family serine peptidase [Cyclobacteriaceae bacterium]|nr:prolyl oligopeptidase family serine peptidase [Cyclobacteriaceae bacterium]
MKSSFTAGLLIFVIGFAVAQTNPQPITWKDIPSWKSIPPASVTLSPDGQWVAYALQPVDGDGEIILQKVRSSDKKTFSIGSTSGLPSMEFSHDSRWFAFKEYPRHSERKANAKTPGKQLFDKLIVVELSSGKKTEYEKVNAFAFNGEASTHIAMHLARERSGTPKPDDPKGNDLLVAELSSGKNYNIGNVSEFAFNKKGTHLAYTIDATNQAGNGVLLFNVANAQTRVISSDKARYQSLNWTEEGDGFAVLKMTKDKKFKQERGAVIGVKNLNAPQVIEYDPQKDSLQFPKNMTISPNRKPMWTEDLTRLLFGIHALEPAKKEDKKEEADTKESDAEKLAKIKTDTTIKSIADLQKAIERLNQKKTNGTKGDTTKPDMTIWHWKDPRLQSRQQRTEQQDKNFSYWGMYIPASAKFIQLNDGTLKELNPMPKHRFALAQDNSAYEWDNALDGQSYTDVYVIDLQSGSRKKVLEKFYLPSFWSAPRPSPDGTKFLYGKDGHYHVYDILSGSSSNITEKVKTSFINTEDDHNVVKPLTPVLGWSLDSRYIVVRDLWDIWQVPLNTREQAVNLTQNGKKEKIRYQSRFVLDPDEKGIDLKKPQYFRTYGEWTKKSGIVRLEAGKNGLIPGPKTLLWEDSHVGRLAKAKKAEVYLFSREKFNQPTEFFVADALLKNESQVTQNAPDAAKYRWSAGVRLVDYISDKGDTLQGALFLPAGYEAGKKYPTIVYYYEKLSQTLHNYTSPGFSGTGWNPAVYTSNGYAVFVPDIVYKINDPGMSAVWCVIPGVKAALKTGVIDENRMGIHGHSWGGYQTCFLITQTNMFKAAAAGAPLTNMISMYDLIYWNTGGSNMAIFEASQGRLTSGPWDNWDAYLRNSPVYHVKNVETPLLMLHNDKDGAVDFTQGIEFYNALRRLKKPVIMVQYKGENHGLSKLENRKDYAVRMMEFFDHHLKGTDAPDWLKNGVEHLKLNEHLTERVFETQQ